MILRLKIQFESAAHHASGFSLAGVVDRGFLRDQNRLPCLSGAGIKGRFRDAARRILLADGEEVCESPGKKEACGPPGQAREKFCRICRLFGAPALPAEVYFGDARPVDTEYEAMLAQAAHSASPYHFGATGVRHGVSLDRLRRTARGEHLFTLETVAAGMEFGAEISGRMDEDDVALLLDCAQVLNNFGGGGGRGFGVCRYEVSREVAP